MYKSIIPSRIAPNTAVPFIVILMLAGKDLCGEDPGQIVAKEYYQTSVIDSTRHFLSRLSREEEAFEQDLLRVIFAHAPTDEKTENESEPISGGTVCEEKLREETEELFRNLKEDAIFCTDGSPVWISTAEAMEMTGSFGNLAMFCNAGKFAAHIEGSGCHTEICKEAAYFSIFIVSKSFRCPWAYLEALFRLSCIDRINTQNDISEYC